MSLTRLNIITLKTLIFSSTENM